MYDAIFFDLDGTLIDTERLAVEAGLHAFKILGHHDAGDLLHSLIGIDMPTAAGMIAPLVGITDPTVAPIPLCTSGIAAIWA